MVSAKKEKKKKTFSLGKPDSPQQLKESLPLLTEVKIANC